MTRPAPMDPILALLEFLESYRRSWRCWLLGGPAALDDAGIGGAGRTAAVRFCADFEYEMADRVPRSVLATTVRDDEWYDTPQPRPPAPGDFRDAVQTFPLADTRAYDWCAQCWGTGRRRCPTCRGQGGRACAFCGGSGCADCAGEQGRQTCPDCGGRGSVPCRCAEEPEIPVLLRYEAARYTYRHEQRRLDLLPEGAARDSVARLFDAALSANDLDPVAGGEDAAALWDDGRLSRMLDPELRERLRWLAAHAQERAVRRAPGRLLFQRLEVRAAPAASVVLRLGGRWRQFRGVGAGEGVRGVLARPPRHDGQELLGWCFRVLLYGYCAAAHFASPGEHDLPGVGYFLFALAGVTLWERLNPTSIRRWARSARGRLRHLHESVGGTARADLVALLGPEPAHAAFLYALFAHLAASAHLADSTQGGTLLDDHHADLAAMLAHGAPAPDWSHTCRMQFGERVGAPQRARLVHVVCPPREEPGGLHRRVLARAAQVWVVLPADAPPEDLARFAGLLGSASRDAAVTVVVDGPPGAEFPLAHPAIAGALEGRACRVWSVDLPALRDRYLSGGVSAAEATEIVRWLAGGEDAPAPQPPLQVPIPAAEAPLQEGGGRERARQP